MGVLEYYTTIEDMNRRDSSESKGRIIIRDIVDVISLDAQGRFVVRRKAGAIEHESMNLNCKFLLCCSAPEVNLERLKNKFNAHYVVKLTDPLRLAKDVTAWAKNEQLPLIGEAEWIKVRYDKGLIVEESFTSAQFAELSYSQKYPASSDENEYRLVVTTSDTIAQDNDEHEETGCENSLHVKLGRRLDYVEYVV
jgi:hypothetical protein